MCRTVTFMRNLLMWSMALGTTSVAGAAGAYLDLRRTPVIEGSAAAGEGKAVVCNACHGETGIAIAPLFPNLQGQSTEYIYWSLVEFKHLKRPESAMTPMVDPLSDTDMRDLAAHYAQMQSAAVAATTPADAPSPDEISRRETGARIFNEGMPAHGVPPCQGCHGVEGAGHPLATTARSARFRAYYRTYPPLKGQQADYLVTRLKQYRDTPLDSTTNDFIMQSVAGNLDDDSIASIAAWLASR